MLTLYNSKELPLNMAIDLYRKCYVPSITDQELYENLCSQLEYDYFKTFKENIINWKIFPNNLKVTKGYISIFNDPDIGILMAYEALSMIFDLAKDGCAAHAHFFSFSGKNFMVITDKNTVIVCKPSELKING